MARAKSSDFLHNFRFFVQVTGFGNAGTAQLGTSLSGGPTAGFNSVSIPEISEDAVEYREGHYIYTQKYCGIPTLSNVTLTRGVALQDETFWAWVKDCVEQGNEYRADLSIYHLHRDSKSQSAADPDYTPTTQPLNLGPTDKGFIEYKCYEAFPVRYRLSGDLDATASEVSIQEIELAVEYVNRKDHGPVAG